MIPKYMVITPGGPMFFSNSSDANELIEQILPNSCSVYVLIPTEPHTMLEDYAKLIGPTKTPVLKDQGNATNA